MINEYVNKLMENLPENITKRKKPMKVYLILGSGVFNGSYILGALYFLKELERRKYIVVKKISASSVSTMLALLYLTDNLDKTNELFSYFLKDFKNKGNLSKLLDVKDLFKKCTTITDDDCSKYLNKKLYICYNNLNTHHKRVVNKYNNLDELFDTIKRSCFVPFIIDCNPCYKDKYVDGFIPYFFQGNKNKNKRIYLDVFTLDKLTYALNVRNEKNNYHRLFEGMLDIHKFFIKQCNTTMCSDLDNWSLYNYMLYYIYIIVEKILLHILGFISFIKSSLLKNNYDSLKPFIEKVIKFFLTTFCF